jgi:DNA segregation ATPase FtsK/SpoIIIE-like protein
LLKSITGRITDTNDFAKVDFEALTLNEADLYISWATDNRASVQYTPELKSALLLRIRFYLPYFINLMLDEINKEARGKSNSAITELDLDNAFNRIIKDSDYFKEWKNRLFDYMSKHEADFMNEILAATAHKGSITIKGLHNIALKHDKESTYMDFVDDLEKDGYIVEHDTIYTFVSPFWRHSGREITLFTMATNPTGNWFVDQLNLYQSANSDSKSLKENFVIRRNEFELIIGDLMNKKEADPLQHELLLGRRGSGKSTLLKRIQIEIEENERLSKKYISINPAEEQAGIYRLFDLWLVVLNELQYKLATTASLKEYATFSDDQAYTRYLYDVINELLQLHNKKVVLLLDNLDRIVENFGDDGNLFREILLNYNNLQIIGGSTRMDEHFWRYDQPSTSF